LFGPTLSWSDLIVMAGDVAVQLATGFHVHFCGGRTDAEQDAGASDFLRPRVTGAFTDSLEQLKDAARVMGLSQREFAALNGLGYVLGGPHDTCHGLFCRRDGHMDGQNQLDNQFFVTLLVESWEEFTDPATGRQLYRAVGSDRSPLPLDSF
jgi:catalase (peroxidase I)